MTTATMVQSNRTMAAQPRPSLEELVDRVIAALFKEETEPAGARNNGDSERGPERTRGAAAQADWGLRRSPGEVFAGMDTAKAETGRRDGPTPSGCSWSSGVSATGTRWSTARAREGPQPWFPRVNGALEVAAVLGMRWRPGKIVSRRSLRGLKPLAKGRA